MPEGHDDVGTARARAEIVDDPFAKAPRGIAGQDRDPLGVEEHHAGPADPPDAPVGRRELHHEEVPLVIERVGDVFELRQRLPAQVLQKLQVLLAPLEGLFHGDHAVPEHSGLRHVEFLQLPVIGVRFLDPGFIRS
jgi:hypothetical protein